MLNRDILEMWANAQRDGCPSEYRWRPLFNAAVWLTPTTECRAVTPPRRETRWNLLGCPKLANGSQTLVGWSSPYCEDIWGRHCCLTTFSPIVDTCLSWKDIVVRSCADGDFWHSGVSDDRRGRTGTAVLIRSLRYTDRCAGVEDESSLNTSVIIL